MGDVLKDQLRKKYRNKSESVILKMLKEMQVGQIDEWIWKEIIKKMYNDEHYALLY